MDVTYPGCILKAADIGTTRTIAMSFSLSWIESFWLISIRFGIILFCGPLTIFKQLPTRVQISFLSMFSALFCLTVSPISELTTEALLMACVHELMNGLILVSGISAAFLSFKIAGRLIDNQMGLNSMTVFNPHEQGQEAFTSQLLSIASLYIFFKTDSHHLLFKGLIISFKLSPPGVLLPLTDISLVFQQFSLAFKLAFSLACPMLLMLLIIEIGGTLIVKHLPQFNSYFFTLPMKIFIGIALLHSLIEYLSDFIGYVFNTCILTFPGVNP